MLSQNVIDPPILQRAPFEIHFPQSTDTKVPLVELNGLHVAFILNGPPHPSEVIFPTCLLSNHPRDYLRLPLSLPAYHSITYDGTCILLHGSNFTAVLSISPTTPAFFYRRILNPPNTPRAPHTQRILQNKHFQIWCHESKPASNAIQSIFTLSQTPVPSRDLAISDRTALVSRWMSTIKLTSPDRVLDEVLDFAHVRLCEAVFHAPKHGKVHSPGGGMYYCGVWTNDQAEYAAPILAMFGKREREVAVNSMSMLANKFEPEREEAEVAYSVEVDGGYIGRLDRGDAAMFAWGLGSFLLSSGCGFEEGWNCIQFLLGILEKKLERGGGIIMSQSDELEGRYPTGTCNLSTNCLAVLAFDVAAEVAKEMGARQQEEKWRSLKENLKSRFRDIFWVGGRKRFQYFQGCDDARGWACLTALAGIQEGADALKFIIDEMWSTDGVLVSSKSSEVWDRCTLYAMIAAFRVGLVEEGIAKLKQFVRRKNPQGIPGPVENNREWARLSAESGLLVRVVTEGLLGITPQAAVSFGEGNGHSRGRYIVMKLLVRCPQEWNEYTVENVNYRDVSLTFVVMRRSDMLVLRVTNDNVGAKVEFREGAEVEMMISTKEDLIKFSIM